METIGKRLRRLRIDRGYKRQVEFAPLVLMTQSSLSDVESKDKEFSARQLLAICRVLSVSPEYVVYGGEEEDMNTVELLSLYKQLDQNGRDTLIKLARALVPSKANSKAA